MPERLRALRSRAGLASRELDRLSGLAPGHSLTLEKGLRPGCSTHTVERLARALGCTVGWLASGEGDPPTDEDIQAAIAAARERRAEGEALP